MTYNVNSPLDSDKLRVFPSNLKTNFWPRIKAIVNGDHDFSDAASATQGYHKIVHFINQAGVFGDGTPIPIAGNGEWYTKTVTLTSGGAPFVSEQVFYQPGTNGAASREVPVTAAPIRAFVNFDGSGALGAQTIHSAFNITSVIKIAGGLFQITMTAAAPSAKYGIVGTASLTTSSGTTVSVDLTNPPTTTVFVLRTADLASAAINAPTYISVTVVGG